MDADIDRSLPAFELGRNECLPWRFRRSSHKGKVDKIYRALQRHLSELTTKPIWTKTGVLSNVDDAFLQAIISFCRHAAFIKLFVRDNSKSGLKVLADLCAARNAPDMFGAPVAESVVDIVYNIMFVVGRQGTEVPAIVKVIESSGMLSQVIRAITVPPNGPDGLSQCLLIIDWFYKCRRQKEASFRISIGGCPNSCPFWTWWLQGHTESIGDVSSRHLADGIISV